MGKSGNSGHKEKKQREVEEKIIDLLSKFEKTLKEELSTAIDPDEVVNTTLIESCIVKGIR